MRRLGWVPGLLCLWGAAASAQPLGTAFTYQGRLTDAGAPASGPYDLQFGLFAVPTGGSALGAPLVKDDVTVAEGLFTVTLDFGPAFQGNARWLEIGVRPGASTGAYTTLTSRMELTPTPNALFAATTPWSGVTGKPAGFADDVDDDSGGTVTSLTAGNGLTGGTITDSGTIAVSFAGAGVANTAARSDHDHAGTYAPTTHNHLGQTWNGTPFLGLEVSTSGQAGLRGISTATAGASTGVEGRSQSTAGGSVGVFGQSTAATGTTYGVRGDSSSADGYGVLGFGSAATGAARGVSGVSAASAGYGVHGSATASTGANYGVWGESLSASGTGVFARALTDGGTSLVAEHSANTGNIAVFTSFGTPRATFAKTGDLTLTGTSFAVNHMNTSDARLKEDVSTLAEVLPRLMGLRAVRFRFRGRSDVNIGVIAQEVQAAFPELVRADDRGNLAVAYGELAAVLLAAVQEQQALIERLEARLDAVRE